MEDIQKLENQIIVNIKNILYKISQNLMNIESTNISQQNININSYMYYQKQLEELQYITDSMKQIISIFELFKEYLKLYYKELSSNQYIDQNSKIQIYNTINESLKDIKNFVDRLFIEIELLSNQFLR